MRTLTFYGASDDLFECDDSAGRDTNEVGAYDRPGIYKIMDGDAGLYVVGHYAPGNVTGCWSVGVMPLDEDVPLPPWPVAMALGGRGYSAVLTLTVPDTAKCTRCQGGDDDDDA